MFAWEFRRFGLPIGRLELRFRPLRDDVIIGEDVTSLSSKPNPVHGPRERAALAQAGTAAHGGQVVSEL